MIPEFYDGTYMREFNCQKLASNLHMGAVGHWSCALCIQTLISVPWVIVTVRTQALLWILNKCGIKNAPQLFLTSQWLGSVERKVGPLIPAKDSREKSQVEGDTDEAGGGPGKEGPQGKGRKHGRHEVGHEEPPPREFSIMTEGYSRASYVSKLGRLAGD